MKKAIRKLLGYFGYDFVKIAPTPFIKKEHKVQVGNFLLVMPAINPLIYVYRKKKDFAFEIGRIMLAVLQKYPQLRFIDVGANVGDTAALIKSLKDIPVLGIEGDPFTFSYLQRNAGLFGDIRIFNNYLDEKDQAQRIAFDKEGWNTTLLPGEANGQQVEFVTLDTLLKKNVPDRQLYKLLKIDTEGYDTKILRGSFAFIEEVKPVIYIEYNRDNMDAIKEDGLSTLLQMERFGYNKVLFYDDRGRFILSTTLASRPLITDLHDYADGKNGLIYYYNICLFHSDDNDIAEYLIQKESERRKEPAKAFTR
ncbi:MAG TPA: FkbM family methyltransferase [Puia sp.]|jgi:FkbM family methyltransferase